MRKLCIAGIFLASLAGVSARAEDAAPPEAAKPAVGSTSAPITLELTPTEAADLMAIIDVAIKASGYSRTTLAALRIGQKLERAGAGK